MASLEDLFLGSESKYADKWENYFQIYERELKRFSESGDPVSLLEIGVQNGGSLELWARYLPSGSTITGVDISPAVSSLVFQDDRIDVIVADATKYEILERELGDRLFDVIIDDGSHISSDIISTFSILFDRLKPGGVYIIEDLHCSYVPEFEGGYRREGSAIEWLKQLVDVVNCDHILPSEVATQVLWSYRHLSRSVASVSFYNSVCVIEKFKTEKDRPFCRLIAGSTGEVVPLVKHLIENNPRYVSESVRFSNTAVRQANQVMLARLVAQSEQIRVLEERLAWVMRESSEAIESLQKELSQCRETVAE
ncbi:class I SAM-dependent methyltransferase (plasmid) [Methylocystis sp. MJC1]|uniref:class I SAM-dependent methyltransferase n=1 Tax=Methylocystis sp. MJC1 TaxID=2654282 RepID=UPI0013EB81D3|nr:class I SAM-dependent methyltransferase [Methylocystis sp. MJC1]MBU6529101.1 class I SAM-dependent methyltransferase [Methylocystis sp. MJC1]UZX14039.1 class I SAM-dependent methyltransferase [Methylocystis sp. MJC1]